MQAVGDVNADWLHKLDSVPVQARHMNAESWPLQNNPMTTTPTRLRPCAALCDLPQ